MPGKGSGNGPAKSGRDYSSTNGRVNGGGVCYLDADAEGLRECIEAVTLSGDAILLARTQDGGALSVRVLSAGRTFMHYPANSVALNELITELKEIAMA